MSANTFGFRIEGVSEEAVAYTIIRLAGRQARLATKETTMFQNPPTPGPAGVIDRRQLEKSVSWTRSERLRLLWYRFRLTVVEMNYATRRMVELQAFRGSRC